MLVEFSIGNFWSFKEIQTLQMQAAKIKSKFSKVDKENLFVVSDKLSLLKSKAIYGANASGKSNLIKAFECMWRIVKDNISKQDILERSIIPFRLSENTVQQPSFFQISFIHANVLYRYGFEATKKEVITEWLFGKPLDKKGVRERYYFTRERDRVDVNEEWYKEGAAFTKSGGKSTPYFRNNSLFLTVVAAFNGTLSLPIVRTIVNSSSIISGIDDDPFLISKSTAFLAENEVNKAKVTEFLKSIDPTIQSIELMDTESPALLDFPRESETLKKAGLHGQPSYDIAVYRSLYDDSGQITGRTPFILSFQEAEGTKKIFALLSLLFVVLEKGGVLFIDELDARLHPRLTRKIIQIFNSSRTNPKNTQLVFVTHDSTLLDAKLLRRDQISFAKKDKFGATELYSLVEVGGVRNDASYEKDYLLGKYDAVPYLNQLEAAFEATAA